MGDEAKAAPGVVAPLISGGVEGSGVGIPAAPPASTTNTTPEGKSVYSGIGGEFKTVEELATYTKGVEDRLVQATARASLAPAAIQAPAPVVTKSIEEEIEEELFQDPKAALAKFKSHIITEVAKAGQLSESKKKFWEEFYSENQDLKPLERLVQSIVTEKNSEIIPLKLSDAKAFIAKEARKMVSMVKETVVTKETELPQGGGAHLPASGSGGAGPKAGAGGDGKVVSFVDQIRQFRNRGRQK